MLNDIFNLDAILWSGDMEWETCGQSSDFRWTHMAEPGADPGFGFARAKEMLDHLESVLANEHVVVKSGKYIVEVKPRMDQIGCSESPTKGKITKKVAEDSKPNKVNVKIADECKPSFVLPPRAVLSSPGTTILLEASKGLVAEKISTSMAENGKQYDFVICIGDDRFDESVFEIIGNAISGNMLSITVYIQCIIV
ncbi:alpha,alpha-trehalose-phosphate synthase [UDP-forming] 6 [Tanacetum coccineum]